MNYPDIYYLPKWSELNQKLEDGIRSEYYLETKYGKIYYPFILRSIKEKIDGEQYYDIITPYGFNGPAIIDFTDKEKLIIEFQDKFNAFCFDKKIVAEYVRFSPWLKNHLDFENIYKTTYKGVTVFIDLNKDFFVEEFSQKCRNKIRKAIKNDILVEFDFDGSSINDFYDVYKKMAIKNEIDDYYLFSIEYINDFFMKMKGNIFIANAYYKNKVISSSIILHHNEFVHYHLSGNDYDYINLAANSLILYEVSKWGKENNKGSLHLGGAFDDKLLQFKLGFTKKGILDYYIGTKIRNYNIYNKLTSIFGKNKNYFPEYR